jgi:hypothetical protein
MNMSNLVKFHIFTGTSQQFLFYFLQISTINTTTIQSYYKFDIINARRGLAKTSYFIDALISHVKIPLLADANR